MKKLLSVAVTSILAVTMVTPAFASEVSHAVVPASTDATYNIESVTPFAEPVTKDVYREAESKASLQSIYYYTLNGVNSYTISDEAFNISGGNVNITLVQYLEDSRYNPVVSYQLVGWGNNSHEQIISVPGTFTNLNTTRTFYNVKPGTYKLRIGNVGELSPLWGNGYLTY
ncbi:hypothetical protein [Paenibacillus polymyxa]|uniref:hypothetical protein n=1 Tax=Paenibacillus polymyxa TaxID=1406 RepID=UPI0008FB0E12|nr:hypothetical protein [Paenibacillus polymyxa]APB75650.1 acid shock protein [Paenibacillus polymyxa]POR25516.1 hypothetical protein CG775_21570 [Paenibacillus polymyxa]